MVRSGLSRGRLKAKAVDRPALEPGIAKVMKRRGRSIATGLRPEIHRCFGSHLLLKRHDRNWPARTREGMMAHARKEYHMLTNDIGAEPLSFLHSTLSAIVPNTRRQLTFTDARDTSRSLSTTRRDQISDLNAILKFGREANGEFLLCLDAGETPMGIVMTFPPGASTAATVLPPSLVLEHEDGRVALVYLLAGEAADIFALYGRLKPEVGDDYTIDTKMPLPFNDWVLRGEDEELIAANQSFTVYKCDEAEAAFFEGEYSEIMLSSDSDIFNGAEVRGHVSDEILQRNIMLSLGSKISSKEWNVVEGEFGVFLKNHLTAHKPGAKDGMCFVAGELAMPEKSVRNAKKTAIRSKNAVTALHLLVLDIDSGDSMEKAIRQVENLGLFAVFYTTHSHGREEIVIPQDAFWKWCEGRGHDGENPNTTAIRNYLSDKSSYREDVIESVRYIDTRHDVEGIKFVAESKPIDKFRIVFLLDTPYVMAKQRLPQREAIQKWEEIVMGMGVKLGIQPDRAARDPSRLFYYPRHPKGTNRHRVVIVGGRPLDWAEIEPVDPRTMVRGGDNPLVSAAHEMGGGQERLTTADNLNLKAWVAQRGDGFRISEVFKDYCDERLRSETAPGKFTCECPFDHEHSNSGDVDDKGCFIQDAGENCDQFRFRCSHNACVERDRLDMIKGAADAGWFPTSALYDSRYDCLIRDEPEKKAVQMPIEVNGAGELIFSKSGQFRNTTCYGAAWFGIWKSEDEKTSLVCQSFRILHVASNGAGGGASVTIQFETRHNGVQEVTFERAMLFDRQDVVKLLAERWFEFEDSRDTLTLLKSLVLPIDTLLVERTGWHGQAFLHPSGTTVFGPVVEENSAKKLRLRGGAQHGDWRGGTLEGWKTAVAPAFMDDAIGREQFALGVMAGGAGIVAGYIGMLGFPILNLHGNTSRGKSTSLKLAASVCGAPNQNGAYHSLRKTDNGMEAILAARSGISIAFDEGKTTNADTLDSMIWMMSHGTGKTRATHTAEARPDREFCGFSAMANEVPLSQMMEQARKSQPGGFHARVCDVDVSGVPELSGKAKDDFFTSIREVGKHNGHAWEPLVRYLQAIGPEQAEFEVDRLTKELAGNDADAFTTRSARLLALVWYAGIIMQERGLIPVCDLSRVMRWAWGTRAVESTLDPFTRAMETLLTSVETRRGSDIYELGVPNGSEERRYKEAVGFLRKDDLQEILLVPTRKLPELCGGHMGVSTLRNQMRERGMLVMPGGAKPKPSWPKLPNGQSMSHYRIDLARVAAFTDG